MMRALRDKRFMKYVLWMIIFVFIGGIFFMWGVRQAGLTEDNRDVVVKGDGIRITYLELDQALQGVLQTYYDSLEGSPSDQESKRLRTKVLDQMIEEAILRKTAADLGIAVQDEEVMENLQRSQYFKGKDGRFSKTAYLQMLQANRISPEAFEADQRRQLLLQKIRMVLGDSVVYSDSELDDFASLLGRRLKVLYVPLDEDEYARKVQVKDEDLKDYYESKRSRYDKPERAKVRHLLLGLPNNATQEDKDRTRSVLEEYRSEVISGKTTFADLVKKYSQDEATKAEGGELGWIVRDSMRGDMRDLENAAFALKPGGVSKPVLSSYGYHLVFMEDHEKPVVTTFSGVREKVLKDYRKDQAARKIFAAISQMTASLDLDQDLAKAAKEAGAPALTSDWFDRASGIPGLKDSKEAAREVSELQIKEWTGPLTLGSKRIFFQLLDSKPGSGKDLLQTGKVQSTAQELLDYRQRIWFKDFIQAQRNKLGVKVLSEG